MENSRQRFVRPLNWLNDEFSFMGVKNLSRIIDSAVVLSKETDRARRTSPLFKVMLHNDPINTMDYVVLILRQVVPQLSDQDAINVMLEAHNTGVGLVITCDLEPPEFYCETLNIKGFTSTIEKES